MGKVVDEQIEAATFRPNEMKGLVPPKGTLWRGSTHWNPNGTSLGNGKYDPLQFNTEWGVPLHIYREFHGKGTEAFSVYETNFIKKGGISFYGYQPRDWKKEIDPSNEPLLRRFAQVVKGV